MELHRIGVPVEGVLLAQTQFVPTIGSHGDGTDTAAVADALERDERTGRDRLPAAGFILVVDVPAHRLVRHAEGLGVEHDLFLVGRDDDVARAHDALRGEVQGLAFASLVHVCIRSIVLIDDIRTRERIPFLIGVSPTFTTYVTV